jgi:hypothetical protein
MSRSRLVKHVSAKQLRANRLNAKQSTGPRTPAGKRTVSLNARTHGLFCKDLVMPGESQAEFDRFAALLVNELDTQGYVELSICEQYVEARWRIRRVRRAEREAHDRFVKGRRWTGERALTHTNMLLEKLFPKMHNADVIAEGLTSLSAPPRPPHDPETVPVTQTMIDSAAFPDGGAYDHLSRLHHRLELSADRAMRQLNALRAERRAHGSPGPCPFVDEVDPERDADADLENESENEPAETSSGGAWKTAVQNKPISDCPSAGSVAGGTCEQAACEIDPIAVTPMPVLHPRSGPRRRTRSARVAGTEKGGRGARLFAEQWR